MSREDIVALLARWEQALRRRDVEGLTSLYDDTCMLESPTAGGPVTGRAAIGQVFRTWFEAFPDSVFTFEDPVIDGDQVVQLITSAGTGSGPFLGLPPTGKPYRIPMVVLKTIRDRQIVHERRIYDFTGLLVQIGVLKAKPA